MSGYRLNIGMLFIGHIVQPKPGRYSPGALNIIFLFNIDTATEKNKHKNSRRLSGFNRV